MRRLDQEFRCRKILDEKLLLYGFRKDELCYKYEKKLGNGNFKVSVEVFKDKIISKVIDLDINDEYLLVDVSSSLGEFVGKIKEEYDSIIEDIMDKCSVSEVFKEEQTKLVISYIKDKYNDELEFLWKKYDDNAIWRNKENKKWYGVLLTVRKDKIAGSKDEMIEVIDLRYQKEKIKDFIDNTYIFPGYHMNKNNWITIKLDGSVATEEIFRLIDNSYEISLSKK